MSTTTVCFSTYLLPDTAGIKPTSKEKTVEHKNTHNSQSPSDDTEYSAVGGTKSSVLPRIKKADALGPPRAKQKKPIVTSRPANTSNQSGASASLLASFTRWPAQANIKLSSSAQRVTKRVIQFLDKGHSKLEFTEIHLAPLYTKLREAVETNPALLMIILVVVQELQLYSSPGWDSTAFQLLYEPKLVFRDFQLAVDGDAPALDRPVIVEGHTWCSLRSVTLKVWLRGVERIDIDSVDPNLVGEGAVFPVNNDMAMVLAMIERGAEAIRQSLIQLCESMVPEMDMTPLQDPNIRLQLEEDDFITKLVGAMSETSYERYSEWYVKTPRPRKPKCTVNDAGTQEDQEDHDVPAYNTRSRKRQR
ncbi:hypothetical protein BDR06DRAFT_1013532 [Suillus hirtellus]|nr:hypothetical protein BDR06DRAFT_1013532 [Suillus hirtellus]